MKLGGKVVFSSGISVDFDIWCLDLDRLSLSQLTGGMNLNDFPKWSPDGKRIAYISTGDDMIPSLWVMAADGGNKQRLTNTIYCQAPAWSPDGSQIIFCGNSSNRSEIDVCTIDSSGGTASTLFSYHGVEETPSYSPDGKRIIFSAPAETQNKAASHRDTEIVEYNLASKNFRVLCSHPAQDYAPAYSPDGKHIAFVSHRNDRTPEDYERTYAAFKDIIMHGNNAEAREAMEIMQKFEHDGDIFVMNSDGGDLKQLTHDSKADNGVCWSPCGNYLMYSSAPLSNHEAERLKIMDAKTGKKIPFNYNREPFEREIGALQSMNRGFLQLLVPDAIEKKFVDLSFWGEERRPHWTR